MKEFFTKLGFHKSDEMEISIQLKAIKGAWLFAVLFLLVWSGYELFRLKSAAQPYNSLPMLLLCTQNLVYFILLNYHQSRVQEGPFGRRMAFMFWGTVLLILLAGGAAYLMVPR